MPMLRQCKQLYRPQRHLSLDFLISSIGGVFLRLSIVVVYFRGGLMLRSTHDEKAQRTQEKTRLNALDMCGGTRLSKGRERQVQTAYMPSTYGMMHLLNGACQS